MIPSINDCTSHWKLTEIPNFDRYIGITFGKNIIVYNGRYTDLTELLNDDSRIYSVVKIICNIYVLLENGNLYKIAAGGRDITYKFIRGNIKNIFVYDDKICMLCNDGKILNKHFVVIYENMSVVANMSLVNDPHPYVFICGKDKKILHYGVKKWSKIFYKTLNNTNNVTNMCSAATNYCYN